MPGDPFNSTLTVPGDVATGLGSLNDRKRWGQRHRVAASGLEQRVLDATQARAKQLILGVDAVPATLRLLDRSFEIPQFRVRPSPLPQGASGGSSRLILSILREAGEQVSQVSLADANP